MQVHEFGQFLLASVRVPFNPPVYWQLCLVALLILSSMCVDVYIAPEVYKNEPFDRSVDVFAFGLILYEVSKAIQSTCKGSRLIMCCILVDVSLR